MTFSGIEVPDILVLGFINEWDFTDFRTDEAQMLLFIEDKARVSRDDLYSKFTSLPILNLMKTNRIVAWNMSDDTYSLTKSGHDLVAIINVLKPMHELLSFIRENHESISCIEDLDVLLTLSGKHHLIDKDHIVKIFNAVSIAIDPSQFTSSQRWLYFACVRIVLGLAMYDNWLSMLTHLFDKYELQTCRLSEFLKALVNSDPMHH